jgi:hypothetical protein
MIYREPRRRPGPWGEHRGAIRTGWAVPWHAIDYAFHWTAWLLSQWAFLEVLEYLGVLSVFFGVVFYYSEAGDRRKQKHYQAWQVINTSQGKGGSGGRIEALQELNEDGVSLVGVDISGAALQGILLRGANLLRADIEASDLRDCALAGSNLEYADLKSANFRRGDLRRADLSHADFEDADLVAASLEGANLTGANLKDADLRNTDLKGVRWQGIAGIESANVYGVRNAPAGFVAWALQHGAISERGDDGL